MSARIAAALAAVIVLLPILALAGIGTAVSSMFRTASPSQTALADIPTDYLALYRQAATVCPGLDWAVLAAIGKIESDHGRSSLPGVTSGENPHGAAGVMQIVPATWEAILSRHQIPHGGASPPSRYNPSDSIHAAAFYLCDNGAPDDLHGAIFAYNHANWYVDQVLAQATRYRQAGHPHTVWPEQQATLPDPTAPDGSITTRLNALYQALKAAGATAGGASCWSPRPHNPNSDHPRGKACDIFFNAHDPAAVTRGWQIAHWLTTIQPTYGIHYLIWQGRIWTADTPTWVTYQSDIYNCPNRANITGCHYDHIHISVY